MIAPDIETAVLPSLAGAGARPPRWCCPSRGAGISTECGIPRLSLSRRAVDAEPADYQFDEFLASKGGCVRKAWRRRFAMEQDRFAAAKPGRGHLAVASLYRAGKAPAVGDAETSTIFTRALEFQRNTSSSCTANTTYALLPFVRQALRAAMGFKATI